MTLTTSVVTWGFNSGSATDLKPNHMRRCWTSMCGVGQGCSSEVKGSWPSCLISQTGEGETSTWTSLDDGIGQIRKWCLVPRTQGSFPSFFKAPSAQQRLADFGMRGAKELELKFGGTRGDCFD